MEHFVLIFRLSTFFCILFSTFYFIQLHYFIIILVFFTHTFPMSALPSPHLHKIPPTHPKSHMEARIFFPFLILMFSFYKHDMYRNSTQTNMFIFSHIRIQLFFKMSFKQSAWASHIRTTMHFVVLLIKSTSDLVRYVLSLFLYTSSTSLGREFPACIRSSLCCRFWCANASLVPLVRARVCMFEIYMAFTCCWCLFRSGL